MTSKIHTTAECNRMVEKAYNRGMRHGIKVSTDFFEATVMLGLQDVLGTDTNTIKRVGDWINEQFDSILKEYITVDDIIKCKEDEIG